MASPVAVAKRTLAELAAELKRRMRNRSECDTVTTLGGAASTRALDWLNSAQIDFATRMRHFELERVVDTAISPAGPSLSGTATGGSATTLIDSGADFSDVLIGQILFNMTKSEEATITSKTGTTQLNFAAVTTPMASGDAYQILQANNFVTMPEDCLFIQSVLDLTNKRRLEKGVVYEMDESFSSPGVASIYDRYGNGIVVDPPYAAYADLKIRYQRVPPRVLGGNTFVLNVIYEEAQLLWAIGLGYEALLEPERGIYYKQLSDADLARRLYPRGEETMDSEVTMGPRMIPR